jgi:competence protein ComEC
MHSTPPADAPHVPTDVRLVAPAVATWAAAVLATVAPRLATAVLVAAAIAAAVALCRVSPTRRRAVGGLALVVLACAAAALVATTARAATARAGPLTALAHRRAVVTLDLTVTGDPRVVTGRVVGAQRADDLVVVPARAERVALGPRAVALRRAVTVFAPTSGWTARLPGERLRVTGRLRSTPGGTPAFEPVGPPARLRAPALPGRVAGRLRAGLRDATAGLPGGTGGLVPGLVVGDTSRLDAAVREDFRRTGLTHVVAVSGQNIAILLAVALLLARRAGLGPRGRAVAGFVLLAFFVLLARPSPSVLRAATMGSLALVGTLSGRERAALRLLAAAVLFLLLADPGLATSLGFALSVAATAGLLVLGPPLRDRLARRLPGWLADAVATPVAAQVACAPLLAAAFGRISLVAIPANVAAAPAIAPATVLGFVTAAVAPLSMTLARAVARLASVPAGWLVTVAHRGAGVPAATLDVPTGLAGAVAALVLTAAGYAVLRRRAGRHLTATAAVSSVLAAALAWQVVPGWPPPAWRLVACDVGQGDALAVRTGSAAVLVDTGPDPLAIDRCLRDLHVTRLAAVVLTHFHADHVEGLPGALRGRRAGAVVAGPLDEPPEERARVLHWSAARRLPVRVAAVGERWQAGDATFEVLAPDAPFHGTDSDPNNSSLVLRVTTPGLVLLLTGDIEEPAQLALLARTPVGHADVLKVPHHGSARQTAEFLTATGAAGAIVSAGAGNPYGHPAPSTIAALATYGMRTYRTDRDGDIAVTREHGRVRLTGRHGRGTAPRPPTPRERALAARRAAAPRLWCAVVGTRTRSRAVSGLARPGRAPRRSTRRPRPPPAAGTAVAPRCAGPPTRPHDRCR